MQVTRGSLLGGRVRYAQPAEGYRTGIEPVLLAAFVPAQAGETVLEAGTGAGAGLLCLLARVPGAVAVGIERDPDLAELARANLRDNGMAATVTTGEVAAVRGPVRHAFANPPWHGQVGTAPGNAGRTAAKRLGPGGLPGWIGPLAAALGSGGTLSLVLPAAVLAEAVGLLHGAGLGGVTLLPLWPRAGVAAKLLLLQGRRGRGGSRVLPGLVLHEGAGYTAAAEAVLRGADGV